MIARPLLIAALAPILLGAWTLMPPSPGAARYRVEIKTSQVVNLTAVGQGQQKTEFTTTLFVSVSSRDSAGGEAVTVVVDSLRLSDNAPIPQELADGAVGLRWEGFRNAKGRLPELTLRGENPLAEGLEPAVSQIFPPMAPGTATGAAWTDTTESKAGSGLSITTVTRFQTSADRYQGARAMKLQGVSSSTIVGAQESPQGAVTIEGQGTSTTTWLLSAEGTTLTVAYSGTQALAVTAAGTTQPVPIEVTVTGAVTRLK